jgi:hypothetical protein
MQVVAEPDEFLCLCGPRQSQRLRAFTEPFADDLLTFRVIVADLQVLLKISVGIGQIALRLHCKHGQSIAHALG